MATSTMAKKILLILFIVFAGENANAKELTKFDDIKDVNPVVIEDKEYFEVKYISDPIVHGSDELIEKRTPNSETYSLGNDEYLKRIYTYDKYIKEGDEWYQLKKDYLTEEEYYQFEAIKQLDDKYLNFLSIKPVYADDIYSEPSDGWIGSALGAGYTWDNNHDAVSGNSISTSSSETYLAYARKLDSSDLNWNIKRTFLSFDTSSIPDSSVVSSAELYFKTNGTTIRHDCGGTYSYFTLVPSDISSNLELDDFDSITYSELIDSSDRLAIGLMTTNTWYEFDISSGNLNYIELDDYTDFAILTGWDYDDVPVSCVGQEYAQIYYSEYTGTSSDPYLEVYYYDPGSVSSTSTDTEIRIDQWTCIASTSGSVVTTTCQAPILIWVVIGVFVFSMMLIIFKYKFL